MDRKIAAAVESGVGIFPNLGRELLKNHDIIGQNASRSTLDTTFLSTTPDQLTKKTTSYVDLLPSLIRGNSEAMESDNPLPHEFLCS